MRIFELRKLNIKKILFVCIAFFIFVSIFVSCDSVDPKKVGEREPHPVFETKYSKEEHIERLNIRTEAIFAEEFKKGDIITCNVEILYSFYDDDPEWFLIELEYAENIYGNYSNPNFEKNDSQSSIIEYETRNKHLIGYIIADEYYIAFDYGKEFMNGKSSYSVSPYSKCKKYCGAGGAVQGVEIGGQIIYTASSYCEHLVQGSTYEYHIHALDEKCWVGEVISPNLYQGLMHFGAVELGMPKIKYARKTFKGGGEE